MKIEDIYSMIRNSPDSNKLFIDPNFTLFKLKDLNESYPDRVPNVVLERICDLKVGEPLSNQDPAFINLVRNEERSSILS